MGKRKNKEKIKLLISFLLLSLVLSGLALYLVPPGSNADAGDLVLVSSTAGGEACSGGQSICISADGRYVAFKSDSNKYPGHNGAYHIYRKDLSTGKIALVSSTLSGLAGTSESWDPSISADGRYVVFLTGSDNFPSYNGEDQVYRKDLSDGSLALVSSTAGGEAGTGSWSPSISSNGRYVAFIGSFYSLSGIQAYKKDLSTGSLVLASSTSGGQEGAANWHTAISADGRYVAFGASCEKFPGYNEYLQVYRKDLSAGSLVLASSTESGQAGTEGCDSYLGSISMSADGRYVAFVSRSDNFPGIEESWYNVGPEVYRKDLSTGALALVSSTPGCKPVGICKSDSVSISADGRYVAFVSDYRDLSLEYDKLEHVYRKDLSTGSLILASSTATGEDGTAGSGCPSISSNGRYIAFVSCSDNFPSYNGNPQVYRKEVDKPTWYLAEGSTAWGFSCYITIVNPSSSEATADITYMTTDGPVPGGTIPLTAMSQTTVNPSDILGQRDFSAKIVSQGGEPIAVDRTMMWTGAGASSPEAHCSVGVNAPATTWYFPEGSSKWGFETWLLVQNPNSTEASCDITYMIEGKGPVTVSKKIAANTRATYNMADAIGAEDASIKVDSDIPVIPERAMYRNNRREGHDSIGTTVADHNCFLAEGCTGYDSNFETYILVQNPNDHDATVDISYSTGSGSADGLTVEMPAYSRKTIRVNDTIPPNNDVSTHVYTDVSSDEPVVAERAMYWDSGSGEACHASIGMNAGKRLFYLPDGQTSDGCETWTLVANCGRETTIEISYLTPSGEGNVVFTDTLPPWVRRSYNMAEKGINGRAAVIVTCQTEGNMIWCERAMYWNSRGAGTDTIGGYSD